MPSLASDIEVCKAVWIWRVFALIMGVYSFYWDSVGTLLFDVGTDCWHFLFGYNPTAQKEYLDSERGLVKTQFCQLGGEAWLKLSPVNWGGARQAKPSLVLLLASPL